MVFAAAPKNPFASDGGGFLPGFSLDQHWERASIQALYAYETPGSGETSLNESEWGKHRFGLSVKADLELGLVADVLYTLNPANFDGIQGLSASVGFDYSFLKGDLYVLFEYLYNGSSSASALGSGGFFINHHFLNGTASYRLNDYSTLSLSTVFCFDDLSFQPMARFDYEVFQGFSLNLGVHLPLDQKTLRGGKAGELGPVPPQPDDNPGERGVRVMVNAGARLRF